MGSSSQSRFKALLIFSSSALVFGRRAFVSTGFGKDIASNCTGLFSDDKESLVVVTFNLATVPISPAEISLVETCFFPCNKDTCPTRSTIS